MGGLVVKQVSIIGPSAYTSTISSAKLLQAYVLGRDDQNYSELVSSISAILFLATPHRGSELAKILNRILTVSSSMNGPKLYLRDLEHDSPTVQTLNEQFRQIAAKLDIFSFYETLYTTLGTQKVVSAISVILSSSKSSYILLDNSGEAIGRSWLPGRNLKISHSGSPHNQQIR
jgi:hypothetical protein